MLESLFSKQVAQPFTLHEVPIDTTYRKVQDNLFRQATLNTDSDNVRLRIIDHNYMEHDVVYLKHIPLEMPHTKVRIRAIAEENEFSIDSSSWVYFDEYEAQQATGYNQYRVRGFTPDGLQSKWTYSSIRDKDNDEILFNLLQDFLDVALSAYDNEIEYFMEYILGDYFTKEIRDHLPQAFRELLIDEERRYGYKELVDLLESHNALVEDEQLIRIKETFDLIHGQLSIEFVEMIKMNPIEFSELIRLHKVSDEYELHARDYADALVYMFLEETLKNIVQKTSMEVILKNDEKTEVLLRSFFDFQVDSELVQEAYEASFSDAFTTLIQDAVQLLTDPSFLDSYHYGKEEEREMEMRMQLKGAWTSRTVLDQILSELEIDLMDRHDMHISGGVVQLVEFFEGYQVSHELLHDFIDVLLDDSVEGLYEVSFKETLRKIFHEKRINLFLSYYPEEIISYLIDTKVALETISLESNTHQETLLVQVLEQSIGDITTDIHTFAYILKAKLSEKMLLEQKEIENIKEAVSVLTLEQVVRDFKTFYATTSELLELRMTEEATTDSQVTRQLSEKLIIGREDRVIQEMMKQATYITDWSVITFDEYLQQVSGSKRSLSEEMYAKLKDDFDNLFFINPKSNALLFLVEHLAIEHGTDIRDMYILDVTEKINYALGRMDTGWPVGKFRLGVNTLIGQESAI